MITKFYASESVAIAVPPQPLPIAQYLKQPQRLVDALQEQSEIQILGQSQGSTLVSFRFALQPLHFLQMRIRPTVDLDAWSDNQGNVYLRSQRSQVKTDIFGIEFKGSHFDLELRGQIHAQAKPASQTAITKLIGNVSLEVSVEVPPLILLTPMPIIQIIGNNLLKKVLLTMKQRLLRQLVIDYTKWASSSDIAQDSIAQGSIESDSENAFANQKSPDLSR
jgi:hypothetical protein